MTTFTDTWNAAFEALPADLDDLNEGASRIRSLKVAISERMEVDHSFAGDSEDGEHKKITFKEQTGDPATVTDKGYLYTKDVGGVSELFWKDENGNVTQITSGGNVIIGDDSVDGTKISLTSEVEGAIMYHDASGNWVVLTPGTSGQFLKTQGASNPPVWADDNKINRETEQATTSGTAFDFTSIPSGVNRITIIFDGVSLDGNGHFLVQIGDAGGIESSGYKSSSNTSTTAGQAGATSTSGFVIYGNSSGSLTFGHMVLTRVAGNTWVASHSCGLDNNGTQLGGGGTKSLSGELDRVRVTRSGTNNFDAGQVNMFYE